MSQALDGPSGAQSGLSDGAFDMLRAAVNAARAYQCRTVKALKEHLLKAWPNREADINAALDYWAADIRRRHPDGPPE